MPRVTRSERLVARLRAMGVALPDEVELLRTNASGSARAAGAWSWAAYEPGGPELRLGSQHSMGELLKSPRLLVSRYGSRDDLDVDPWQPRTVHWRRWDTWLEEPENSSP